MENAVAELETFVVFSSEVVATHCDNTELFSTAGHIEPSFGQNFGHDEDERKSFHQSW